MPRHRKHAGSQAFSPYRNELLLLGRALPLKAARDSAENLLKAVRNVVVDPSTADYYIIDMERDFLPPVWRLRVEASGLLNSPVAVRWWNDMQLVLTA